MTQIYYFTGCCGNVSSFGITSGITSSWNDFIDTPGYTYGVVISSFSGCVTYSGSSIEPIPNLPIINGNTPLFSLYDDCQFCVRNVFPCYTTPTPTPPTTVIGYKNECGIISILPMVVECVTSNPSTYDSSDGEVSLKITGGTPPYTTTWTNGPISPAFGGLPIGSYTATTVDYWGDYTATTVCVLNTEPDCSFSGSVVENICINNIIINGNFTSSLDGWTQTIFGDWVWSSQHGGSANYIGLDESSKLYQNTLTIGDTYNIKMTLYKNTPCYNEGYIIIYAGTNSTDQISTNGITNIDVTLTCTDTNEFLIQAQDACVFPATDSIFINNICVTKI